MQITTNKPLVRYKTFFDGKNTFFFRLRLFFFNVNLFTIDCFHLENATKPIKFHLENATKSL